MKQRIVSLPAIITCVALAVISAAVWGFMQSSARDAEGVNIYKDGKLVSTIDIDENTEYKIDKLTIKVENKYAFISESNCRCKTCIGFGKLSKAGQTAVCLPNKITVELFGKSDVDAAL